jgi:DNA-binding NarL/FixJ family response regulator
MSAAPIDALDRGRVAYAEQRWGEAYDQLVSAERSGALGIEDLERLAVAAYVTGKDEARAEAFARAYHECLKANDTARAMRYAFWSGFGFVQTGERSRADGWFMRALELLHKVDVECVERGYMRLAIAFRTLEGGDIATAQEQFGEAVRIGERFGDTSLAAMARQGVGRMLIHLGRTADGVALLDEAMVAVTAGEVSPLFLGNVYCSVIEACKEMYDIRRAQEWTSSLSRWCASQPDMLPYRGNCLVFRAELMRLHGAWSDAMAEAIRAHEALRDLPEVGAALYQQGELHRLRGDLVRADEAFRAASATGHSAQPGLALLRLAQGNHGFARASMRRALDETRDPVQRAPLLPACVEISLAARDLASARAAVAELAAFASGNPSAYLRGIADHASAMVFLADADATAAVPALRAAWAAYREIDAPYESARVRELLGRAYRALGDDDAAEMELDAARSVYERLDAVPDITRLERGRAPAPATDTGLTSRELEVLALVAMGRTNRQVADELVISEKTVARHISNIFDKLGLSSRSGLTAYAYERGLVARSG